MNQFILIEEPSPLNPEIMVKRIEMILPDGRHFSVPEDPANSDYQRYLAWLENPEAEHFTPIATAEDLKTLGL